jgi:hypothetical protein
VDGWVNDDQGSFTVYVTLAGPSRSVGQICELAMELQTLLNAAAGGGVFSARTALNLIKVPRVEVMLGQPESLWLDAKRAPYPLVTEAQHWEFVKDVAAFANTGEDALILIGVDTVNSPNGDVLGSPRPFKIATMDPVALRASARQRITPVIPDLEVGVVESQGGYGYGWIFVPAQPVELLPFIVAGALLDGDFRGGHLSIPIRAVEDTVYTDAAAVHSLLAAGRVALRQAPWTGSAETSKATDVTPVSSPTI